MNARFMATGAVLGLVLAVAALAPQTVAQVGGDKGIFGDIKVGQMVEVRNDPKVGLIVQLYDDPAPAEKMKMAFKVIDVERDYIALDYQDAASDMQLEMRYPINAIAGVSRLKKKAGGVKPGAKKKTD